MRIAVVTLGLLVGCQNKIETKPVSTLEFPSVTIAAPAGWSEIIDQRVLKAALANSHTIKPDVMPRGFAPSIYIQEIAMGAPDHATVTQATDASCRTAFLEPMAKQNHATAVSAKTIDLGAFKGCDLEMDAPDTQQGSRNISVSNGTVAISLTCNRDKAGAPDIDAICMALVRAIVLKK